MMSIGLLQREDGSDGDISDRLSNRCSLLRLHVEVVLLTQGSPVAIRPIAPAFIILNSTTPSFEKVSTPKAHREALINSPLSIIIKPNLHNNPRLQIRPSRRQLHQHLHILNPLEIALRDIAIPEIRARARDLFCDAGGGEGWELAVFGALDDETVIAHSVGAARVEGADVPEVGVLTGFEKEVEGGVDGGCGGEGEERQEEGEGWEDGEKHV